VIETNNFSGHVAGIIPVAGISLEFNMPWHDSLIPIHKNYHAIERAVNTAASAGCSTIWIVLHRETQPLFRKIIGEWVYDPLSVWKGSNVFFNKIEIPVYYVAINPKDRLRRDSLAWSCLYGARVCSYVCAKISKWVVPKKYFVVSPYGVINEEIVKKSRDLIKSNKNIIFTKDSASFLKNNHLPFSFSKEEFEKCKRNFKEKYTGDETRKTFGEVFEPINLENYESIEADWFYDISSWDGYRDFLSSTHSIECQKPKYMINHKWWGFVKDT